MLREDLDPDPHTLTHTLTLTPTPISPSHPHPQYLDKNQYDIRDQHHQIYIVACIPLKMKAKNVMYFFFENILEKNAFIDSRPYNK
jgi:hypothetical protein